MSLFSTLVLLSLSFALFAEEGNFVPPWKEENIRGEVRRTQNPYIFLVSRGTLFATRTEAEEFAKTRTESKVIEQKTDWLVTHYEPLDISSIFSENERTLWKSGQKKYSLWLTLNRLYERSVYIRDGKLYSILCSSWRVDETIENIARMKLEGRLLKSEKVTRGEYQYIVNTYEREIPLKSSSENQFLIFSRAQEHLLLNALKNHTIRQPGMRELIVSEIFKHDGFVVGTSYSSESGPVGSVECMVPTEASVAEQLLIRSFFALQDATPSLSIREIDGNKVLVSEHQAGWVASNNAVYLFWGDKSDLIKSTYLKKFPSVVNSFHFDIWCENEIDVTLNKLRIAVEKSNSEEYFFAYLYLSRFIQLPTEIPVIAPPYWSIPANVVRWHFKHLDAWISQIKERNRKYKIRNGAPICIRDALKATIRWQDASVDLMGASAVDLDLKSYRDMKKEEELKFRRQMPSDDELKKSALIALERYLTNEAKRIDHFQDLKKDADTWSFEWRQSSDGAWNKVSVIGPIINVNREDPVSASAIFEYVYDNRTKSKRYFRFDPQKKEWGDGRVSP